MLFRRRDHDFDNNTHLDGLEVMAVIRHIFHMEGKHSHPEKRRRLRRREMHKKIPGIPDMILREIFTIILNL